MDYEQQSHTKDLENIIDDIDKTISDLEQILKLIAQKESIDSYKSIFCTTCDKPCGRSNAEIYNCMIHRLEQTKDVKDRYNDVEYAKEYLEKDLKSIVNDLRKKNKNLKDFFDKTKNRI
jgi:CRISPR/Cas system-associated endonuclease Cas1